MFDLNRLAKTGDKQIDGIMQEFWQGVVEDSEVDNDVSDEANN